jgi:hypothetical protein
MKIMGKALSLDPRMLAIVVSANYHKRSKKERNLSPPALS